MQAPASYTETFDREHGCTIDEWRMWLPGAVGGAPLDASTPDAATVHLPGGTLHLQWQALPLRRIALMRLPRLQVRYRFERVPAPERVRFMQHFDRYMQRGGG